MIHRKLDQLLESVGQIPDLLKEVKKTLRAVRGLRHRVDELEKRVHNLIIEGKECRLTGMGKPFQYPFPEDVGIPPVPGVLPAPGPPQSPITVLYGVEPAGGGGTWEQGDYTVSTNVEIGDGIDWMNDGKTFTSK